MARPVLDSTSTPAFANIEKNANTPSGSVGILISTLIDSGGSLNNFSDTDNDSAAIAIIGTNTNGGSLYYSIDNGSNWIDVGTVSEPSARVLYADSNTRLAFVPATDYSGTISDLITFKAWDRTEVLSNTPTLASNFSSNRAQGVVLSADNNTAYLADMSALRIINVSDTSQPQENEDAQYTDVSNAYEVALSTDESKLYLVGGESGLLILDISSPTTTTLLGSYDKGEVAHDVAITSDETYAFVANRNLGLVCVDISDSENPSEVGTGYDTDGSSLGVALSSDNQTAYVAHSTGGLLILDVSNPSGGITQIGQNDIDIDDARGVAISPDGNTAFVADLYDGLRIINISNPASPVLISTFETPRADRVTLSVDGNTAFIGAWSDGLKVIDVSDLEDPSPIGTYNTPGNSTGVAVSADNKTAFVCDWAGGLQIINVVDQIANGASSVDTSAAPIFSSASDTASIFVSNSAPAISDAAGTLAFTENDGATVIDDSFTITDLDDTNIESATITISSGFQSAEDVLAFTDGNGITGSWNASTGGLTLSGPSSKNNYKAALESVTYNNTSDNPNTTDRTISWVVNDGDADSSAVTSTISVAAVNDAPTTTGAGSTLAFTENDGATVIDDSFTITDDDDTNIESATITISSGFQSAEDVLAFTDGNGITGSWNASTGGLTLSGPSSKNNYKAALESVTYNNTSDNPNTTDRTISWVVNDGDADSSAVTSTISVAAVNDAPSGSVTISGTSTQGETLTAANTLADLDGLGSIGYQWKRDGSAISGATSSTYLLGRADVGSTITVTANYTDGGGKAESVTSISATPMVASRIYHLSSSNTIDGIANSGIIVKNKRGKTFSDTSSSRWDIVKAVKDVNDQWKVLLRGDNSHDGKWYCWNVDETGVITGGSGWKTTADAINAGWDSIFGNSLSPNTDTSLSVLDVNANGIVDDITNYHLTNGSNSVRLHSTDLQSYSHESSANWDVSKAVEINGAWKVLVKGANSMDGMWSVWDAGVSGTVTQASTWMSTADSLKEGWEQIFGDVIQVDSIIGPVENQNNLNSDGLMDNMVIYHLDNGENGDGMAIHNSRGNTYSDASTSRWDAVLAVEDNNNDWKVLLQGTGSYDGKWYYWNVDDTGLITSGSGWKSYQGAIADNWESFFGNDLKGFNNNQLIIEDPKVIAS